MCFSLRPALVLLFLAVKKTLAVLIGSRAEFGASHRPSGWGWMDWVRRENLVEAYVLVAMLFGLFSIF